MQLSIYISKGGQIRKSIKQMQCQSYTICSFISVESESILVTEKISPPDCETKRTTEHKFEISSCSTTDFVIIQTKTHLFNIDFNLND